MQWRTAPPLHGAQAALPFPFRRFTLVRRWEMGALELLARCWHASSAQWGG